jgi:hypothetical protein
VIIGKLIPAGTGFVPGRFSEPAFSQSSRDQEVGKTMLAEALPDDEALAAPPPTAAD